MQNETIDEAVDSLLSEAEGFEQKLEATQVAIKWAAIKYRIDEKNEDGTFFKET